MRGYIWRETMAYDDDGGDDDGLCVIFLLGIFGYQYLQSRDM